MQIVGSVTTKEEADDIVQIAKYFVVGQRARYLASEITDKVTDEIIKELDKTNYLKYFGKKLQKKK